MKLVKRICANNPEAMDFIANHWAPYCHEIDDIIDGERLRSEAILETFARAPMLYSHPFYLKHLDALRAVVLNVTNIYCQTVQWEGSKLEWQRQWADHHRHCSSEMVMAIAQICGGYAHARATMEELRVMSYHEHHDLRGDPK